MGETTSRLTRALRLLGLEEKLTGASIADVLWLANVLPPMDPGLESADIHSPDEHQEKDESERDEGSEKDEKETTDSLADRTSGQASGGQAPVYPWKRPSADEASVPATLIAVPAADALPNRLALERALKPFLKRFPSRRLKTLDEIATAEASADLRAIMPVFVPRPERWFDVLLLLEQGDAMEVWVDTVRELEALLARHGAFRQARVVRFGVRDGQVALSTISNQPLSARAAADPDGRRLCLFLTDGTSAEWRRAPLTSFIRSLGLRTVVAIIQMLPQRAWAHTVLGSPVDTVRSDLPGAPNSALWREDPFTGLSRRTRDAAYTPVLALDAPMAKDWAQFVMSPRNLGSAAVTFEPVSETSGEAAPELPGPSPSVENRIADFRSIASKPAFQLMRLLAAAPLTLAVMRLVQQSMRGPNEPSQLAEVMLSGLIERVTPKLPPVPVEQVFYEFIPGVRERLAATLSSRESSAVDEALLPSQERVRQFVEQQTGRKIKNFQALLQDPQGAEKLPASLSAFVHVSRHIYEMRGLVSPAPGPTVDLPVVLKVDAGSISQAVMTSSEEVFALTSRWSVSHWRLGSDGSWSATSRFWPYANGIAAAAGRMAAVSGPQLLLSSGAVQKLPASADHCAISPDGRTALLVEGSWLRVWDIEREETISFLGAGYGTAWAISDDSRIFAFISDGALELQQPGGPISLGKVFVNTALAISSNGRRVLFVVETGLCLWDADSPVRPQPGQLPETPTCLAMTPDSRFAAVGFRGGRLAVYNLHGDELVHELRHGTEPIIAVSITADARRLLSATSAEIKVWDLPAFARSAPLEMEIPKTGHPRLVAIAPIYGASAGLATRVREALIAAGHTLVNFGDATTEYEIIVNKGPRNPYLSDALHVSGEDDIPGMLRELEKDPPGKLFNLPPQIVMDVERPQLEDELTSFLQEAAATQAAIIPLRCVENARAEELIAKVLEKSLLRRLFPGGIYWNSEPPAGGRKGTRLVILEPDHPVITIKQDLGRALSIMMLRARTKSPQDGNFEVRLPTRSEADNHILRRGIVSAAVSRTRRFHRDVPLLITTMTGILKAGRPFPKNPSASISGQFEALARIVVQGLKEEDRSSFFRFAAFLSPPPPELLPNQSAPGYVLVRECGWLYDNNVMIRTARNALNRRFRRHVIEQGHEWICRYYDERSAVSGLEESDYYALSHLLAHAEFTGIQRVERFMRNPAILSSFLRRGALSLISQLNRLHERTPYLERLSAELSAQSWDGSDLDRVNRLIASLDDSKVAAPEPAGKSSEVRALIVAIEDYSHSVEKGSRIGPLDFLDSAGRWALQLADLLMNRGVPASNIVLALSVADLPEYEYPISSLASRGVRSIAATGSRVIQALPQLQGKGTLLVYWMGRAVVQGEDRMLLTPEPNTARFSRIRLAELLDYLRTSEYPQVQMGFFDVASVLAAGGTFVAPPIMKGATGSAEQYLIFSAFRGETASDLSNRPGLSSILLEALKQSKDLPPVPGDFFSALEKKLRELAPSDRPFVVTRSPVASSGTEEPTTQRAQAEEIDRYNKLGAELLAKGDITGALQAYQELSVGQRKVGDILRQKGDFDGALHAYRESLRIAQSAVEIDPLSGWGQNHLSGNHISLGDVLLNQGDLTAALAEYQQALQILQGLAVDPLSGEWLQSLNVAHDRIGDVLLRQGDRTGALTAYQQALQIAQRLFELDPRSSFWLPAIRVTHLKIGDVLRDQGDLDGALAAYQQSLQVAQRIFQTDPSNGLSQRDLIVSQRKVGDLLFEKGDRDGALATYGESLQMICRLGEANPEDADWQHHLSEVLRKVRTLLEPNPTRPIPKKVDYAFAASILRKLLPADELVLGPDPSDTLREIGNLANLIIPRGNLA